MFICWHIEEAYYHYLDVLVPDRSLGLRFCSFNVFAAQLIKVSGTSRN
jgi:hypothetical protein